MIDLISAFLLGLGIIIHPCAVAPNIAAMTFIGNRSRRVVLALTMYVVGHALAYLFLGGALVVLTQQSGILATLQEYTSLGHSLLAAVFLLGGVWLIASSFHQHDHHNEPRNVLTTPWGALLSGTGIAFLFCPEAAIVFFGVLVPMAVASESGFLTIVAFAVGSCLPLGVFVWIMKTGKQQMLARFHVSRTLLNRILGVLFIAAAVVMYFL